MKRTIAWILVLSMLLSILPGIPLTAAASTADDPNYIRYVSIRWGENGEYDWNAVFDHEQQMEFYNNEHGLPEGVSYETGHLTLNNADLFEIVLDGWGTIPFHLEII